MNVCEEGWVRVGSDTGGEDKGEIYKGENN